jgi:hypothetical protein
VSFTTFAYVSPVQTIPWCDQTGTPAIAFDGFLHFRSSIISGSASRISARMRAKVSSRQSPSSRLRWSMSREAGFPAALALGFEPVRAAAFLLDAAGLRDLVVVFAGVFLVAADCFAELVFLASFVVLLRGGAAMDTYASSWGKTRDPDTPRSGREQQGASPSPGEELLIPARAWHKVRNLGRGESRWLYGYRR